MFLATTSLTEYWNKNKKLILLGKWCLKNDKRDEWQNLNYEELPYPWDDVRQFDEAYRYSNEVATRIFPHLCDVMNEINEVKHSRTFWHIVLYQWFLYHTRRYYERYVCLCAALRRYPKLTTIVIDPSCYYTPFSAEDDLMSMLNDQRNLQIYSQLFEFMGYKFPQKKTLTCEDNPEKSFCKNNKNTLRHVIRAKSILLFYTLLKNWIRVVIESGVPSKLVLTAMIKSRLRIFPLPALHMQYKPVPLESEKRKKLARIPAQDEFEHYLVKGLSINLPRAYLEYFKVYEGLTRGLQLHQPVSVVSSSGWYGNEVLKMYSGFQKESGGKLIGIQHGGNYGTSKIMDNEEIEVELLDRFYSWGWSSIIDCEKIKPMPSFVTMEAKRQKKAVQDRCGIVLVLNNYPRYMYRMQSVPIGPQVASYLDGSLRFLKCITDDLRSLLTVRPYMADYGHKHVDRLLDVYPGLHLDSSGEPFNRCFINYRLVVIDHHSTTFLQTLAANHPTILFWDPALFQNRPESEPFLMISDLQAFFMTLLVARLDIFRSCLTMLCHGG